MSKRTPPALNTKKSPASMPIISLEVWLAIFCIMVHWGPVARNEHALAFLDLHGDVELGMTESHS